MDVFRQFHSEIPHNISQHVSETTCEEFRHILLGYVMIPVCVLGTTGNVLSFIIFSTMKSHPIIFLLKMLAVCDTTFVLVSFLCNSIGEYSSAFKCHVAPYLNHYIFPLASIAINSLSLITCLISFYRFYVVCYPLRAHKLPGKRGIRYIVALIFLITIFLDIPRFFEVSTKEQINVANRTCIVFGYTDL